VRVERNWGVYKETVREYYEDEMVIHMKKKVSNKSIQEYLHLYERAWFVEFDLSDFGHLSDSGASLSTLFELPPSIYHSQAKAFFWTFIDQFLQRSAIGFILNNKSSGNIVQETKIDLAIIGHWNNKEYAIPLWIMNDILIGFEILSKEYFAIIDAFSLNWQSPSYPGGSLKNSDDDKTEIYVLNSDLFQNNILYLKIAGGNIFVSDFNKNEELKFFERIASTIIPELDDINFEE
jgi:hypothetical protein